MAPNRSWRRAVVRAVLLLVVLMTTVLPGGRASADSHTVPVTVMIWRFEEWDDPDPGSFQHHGDYYSQVQIGDFATQESGEVSGNPSGGGLIVSFPYTIEPDWTFTREVDRDLGEVPIGIKVIDADGFGSEPDDVMDVSPIDDDTKLSLVFDLETGEWRGDIPDNQGFGFGDGDTEHLPDDEGGEQGKVFFAISNGNTNDRDGDGLLDSWEIHGLDEDGDGTIDNDLPGWGADPDHKDLFLELDWMTGESCRDDNDGSCLSKGDVSYMKQAFAAAPLNAGSASLFSAVDAPPNPDGVPGINLWVDTGDLTDPNAREDGGESDTCGDGVDNGGADGADDADPDCLVGDNLGGGNEIPAQGMGKLGDDLDENGRSDFYDLKHGWPFGVGANFNNLRSQVFRYGMSALADEDEDGGGWGEIRGNDFIEFTHTAKTQMHELGHNLGLYHGGSEDRNCKPNYVSIMNYLYQGIPQGEDEDDIIYDYSAPRYAGGRGQAPLPDLDEDNLDENLILDPSDLTNRFIWLNGGTKIQTPLNANPDWNQDGDDPPFEDDVTMDIDYDPDDDGDDDEDEGDCDDENEGTDRTLKGFDDWVAISLPFRHFGNSAGEPINLHTHRDPTFAEQRALWDEINTTDLAVTLEDDPDPVVAGTSLDYTVSVTNLGPNPSDETSLEVDLPDGATLAANDADCDDGSGTVVCDLGVLLSGGHRHVGITADVAPDLVYDNGGPITVTATASVDNLAGPDPHAANDEASETTDVVAEADLEIASFGADPQPTEVLIGEQTPVTVATVIANHGPSSPMDVHLEHTASADSGAAVDPTSREQTVVAVETLSARTVSDTFDLTCSEPGEHTFSFAAEISPARADDTDADLANNDATFSFTVDCVVPVAINIRPKGSPNSVNLRSEATLAVLTTEPGEYDLPMAFDATAIDGSSTRFGAPDALFGTTGGGAPEVHGKGHPERSYELDERTRDADTDMVLHYAAADSGLDESDDEACVKGRFASADGAIYTFFGCDSIVVRP